MSEYLEKKHAPTLPVIDIGALWREDATNEERVKCINEIGQACRFEGFFYIVNHGIVAELEHALEEVAEEYFSLPDEEKREIAMSKAGLAWRGSFLLGEELTSGIPDQKEGVYYGEEVDNEDVDESLRRPLEGKNLFHDSVLGHKMRVIILDYMAAMKQLGDLLMGAVAASLGLQPEYFGKQFDRPTQLFRMFHYPPHNPSYGALSQAVGEHTDYGYLTILKQDQNGGLQVKKDGVWVDATPIDNSFVVNLGDALEHNTGGLLRATPHRVTQRLNATSSRFSFPFFYDPSFSAVMQSVTSHFSEHDKELLQRRLKDDASRNRWDSQDPTLFQGTYGDYLLKKVSKVFPLLAQKLSLDSEI